MSEAIKPMHCTLCPLQCGVDRKFERGICGVGSFHLDNGENPYATALIARTARHYYEEPPISGKNGSGAVFFSGCNMACIFCQNSDISRTPCGKPFDEHGLCDIMLRLQALGSHNINLVTPAPHIELIIKAITRARSNGLSIPIVYNTNAYEKLDAIKRLEGYVDIYLPDLKYINSVTADRYSGRPDYFQYASNAVIEMHRQCGVLAMDSDGIAKRGLIIRHLVLPGSVDEARGVMDFISDNLPNETHISLMSQYTPPMFEIAPPLDRRLLKREYKRVVDYAVSKGFPNVYTQKLSSASSAFTPDFNDFFE